MCLFSRHHHHHDHRTSHSAATQQPAVARTHRRHPHRFTPSSAAAAAAASSINRTRCQSLRASLYDLLGVTSGASTPEIRSAYRRLAARLHPDANASLIAHERFQAVTLAVEVLTSEALRAAYDSRGTSALPATRYRQLLDFLKDARSGGGASLLGEPGGDISTVLGVDFSEAVTGSTASVTMGALGACPDCRGSGSDASFRAADCRVCKGSGEILVKRWSPGGSSSSSSSQGAVPVLTLPQACPACRGSGKSESQDCSRCAGEGRVQLRRKVRFKVPAGVVDGQVLRVKGQGHSGKFGGAPGDLLVKLQVYDLADVTRHGDDLHSVLVLPLYEALLGGSVLVDTVRGQQRLQVPAGTQHGQQLCVRGAGVARPGLRGVEHGHHFFSVTVEVPSAAAASGVELALLQQLAVAAQQPQQPGSPESRRHARRQSDTDGDAAGQQQQQQPQDADQPPDVGQQQRQQLP